HGAACRLRGSTGTRLGRTDESDSMDHSCVVTRLHQTLPSNARLTSDEIALRSARAAMVRVFREVDLASIRDAVVTVGEARRALIGAATEYTDGRSRRIPYVIHARTDVPTRSAVLGVRLEVDALTTAKRGARIANALTVDARLLGAARVPACPAVFRVVV